MIGTRRPGFQPESVICAVNVATVVSRACALLLGLLLAACITPPKVSPGERRVDRQLSLGFGPLRAPIQNAWWTAYRDPQLDRLIAAALVGNPTLGEALARLRRLRPWSMRLQIGRAHV